MNEIKFFLDFPQYNCTQHLNTHQKRFVIVESAIGISLLLVFIFIRFFNKRTIFSFLYNYHKMHLINFHSVCCFIHIFVTSPPMHNRTELNFSLSIDLIVGCLMRKNFKCTKLKWSVHISTTLFFVFLFVMYFNDTTECTLRTVLVSFLGSIVKTKRKFRLLLMLLLQFSIVACRCWVIVVCCIYAVFYPLLFALLFQNPKNQKKLFNFVAILCSLFYLFVLFSILCFSINVFLFFRIYFAVLFTLAWCVCLYCFRRK